MKYKITVWFFHMLINLAKIVDGVVGLCTLDLLRPDFTLKACEKLAQYRHFVNSGKWRY